jgi:hemerythrin-like metal-binding protein
MPSITWVEEMSVGVKALDDDHKEMIDILNELNDGFEAHKSNEILGNTIDRLMKYVSGHVAREEALFVKTCYPEAAAHAKEHDQIIKRTLEWQERFLSGSVAHSGEIKEFLSAWIVSHIQGADKMYAAHLKAQGIV